MKSLNRFYQTVRYLKWTQVIHQVYYRARPFVLKRVIFGLRDVEIPPLHATTTSISFPYLTESEWMYDHTFRFLNRDHSFGNQIDWNCIEHGKLWCYHLNYFQYLNQKGVDLESGFRWMRSFSNRLEHRTEGMEPYPTSLRTMQWVKFMIRYQHAPTDLVGSLYIQYQVLLQRLEYHLLGNHLLENGFALLFGALFFQDRNLSRRASSILNRELKEQYLDDGAHAELSPMYHVILLERLLDAYNMLKSTDHDVHDLESLIECTTQRALNWLVSIRFSNGDLPMVNDSTPGQAMPTDQLLDYAGKLGFHPKQITLSDSGYRKLSAGQFELFTDIGDIGLEYQPGHSHADTLSFVMNKNGYPILVDRGVTTYEKNKIRQEERGTRSHNTVTLNGENSSDVWDGFRVGRRANATILEERDGYIRATHDGFRFLRCRHEREWKLMNRQLQVTDLVQGNVLSAVACFHFHPDVILERISEHQWKVGVLMIEFDGAGKIKELEYPMAEGFNTFRIAKKLEVPFKRRLVTTISE